MPAEPKAEPTTSTVLSIKGTDRDMRCRGFQYELNKIYTHDGPVVPCKSGFHAVPETEHPLSVFSYYPPGSSRYFLAEQGGYIERRDDKAASTSITLTAELSLADLARRAVEFVTVRAKKTKGSCATGSHGSAAATGERGSAAATGERGSAAATGERGSAAATGLYGSAAATGWYGSAAATGLYGSAVATGSHGSAAATGLYGSAVATGSHGSAAATGLCGSAVATGERGSAVATGPHSVAVSAGHQARAMGAEGCALFLTERDRGGAILAVAAIIVGRDGIKPLTLYTLTGGVVTECGQ
jgi:hypothetical protein